MPKLLNCSIRDLFGPKNMLKATCNIVDWLFTKLVIMLPITTVGMFSSSFGEIPANRDISVLLHPFEPFSKDICVGYALLSNFGHPNSQSFGTG